MKDTTSNGEPTPTQLLVSRRPSDVQVPQIYRLSADPMSTAELQRITYFDIGAGRTMATFRSIVGEDWRDVWRGGGAIMAMDTDGNEMFQLWYVIRVVTMIASSIERTITLLGATGKILYAIRISQGSMESLTILPAQDVSSDLRTTSSSTVTC